MTAPARTDALAEFAAEVGSSGPVTVVGGRTQWEAGGPVDERAREVAAPAGVVDFEPAEMTVRVRAGTTVTDLDAALAEGGQTVALPAWPGATVGGVLAVGRSGVRRLGWGPVRDTVLEVRMVTAEGRLVKAGGPTVKNVSGYDLCRLVVGSLGTVGLLGEVVLRTRPIPPADRWIRCPGADPSAVLAALHRPSAVLWDGSCAWALLEGHQVDVDTEASLLAERLGAAPAETGPDIGGLSAWRSLAPAQLRGHLADLEPGSFVAQIGVGVVHLADPSLLPPTPADSRVVSLNRRVKDTFDPSGRLNPGRDPLATG